MNNCREQLSILTNRIHSSTFKPRNIMTVCEYERAAVKIDFILRGKKGYKEYNLYASHVG